MKFFYSTVTCSTASHIVLEEAGAKFTPVEVSWSRKVNVAELEAVNPLGAVPTLEVEGKVITQSAAIMEFIADSNPDSKLLPKPGSVERAQVLAWVSFISSDFQKAFGPFFRADEMTSSESAREELKVFAKKNVEKYLDHIEKSLAGQQYLVGKSFTIADAHMFVAGGWCKWIGIKISSRRNFSDYLHRTFERPAVQKVLKAEGMLDYLKE